MLATGAPSARLSACVPEILRPAGSAGEVAKNLNVGHLMMLLRFGNMGKNLAKYNTQLFAEKVMPKVKDLFGDWEDKWWPKPLAKGQRASVPAFRPQLAAAE